MVTPGASACIPNRMKPLSASALAGNLVMNLAGRASPIRIDPKKSRGGCRREVQCTAERRPRPHRKGRRRRREQSAWEVFLGFLIFFTVACEQEREREGGSGEREPSGKAPPESHLRHTLSAVSGPAVPAPPTAAVFSLGNFCGITN